MRNIGKSGKIRAFSSNFQKSAGETSPSPPSSYATVVPVDTGRKLKVHKTSWTSSERLMYVQFMSCAYRIPQVIFLQSGNISKKLSHYLCNQTFLLSFLDFKKHVFLTRVIVIYYLHNAWKVFGLSENLGQRVSFYISRIYQ